MKMILSNQAKCLRCGDTPFSAHGHDFRHCSCGAMAVDGGMNYLRRLGSPGDIEEMSIVIDDEVGQELLAAISDPSRNPLGHLCAVARVLRDRMNINIGDY